MWNGHANVGRGKAKNWCASHSKSDLCHNHEEEAQGKGTIGPRKRRQTTTTTMKVLGRNIALTTVLGLLSGEGALAKLKGEREAPQQQVSPLEFGQELHRALGYEECCVWECAPPPPPPPPYYPYPPMGPKDKYPKDKGPKHHHMGHKDKGPKHMGPKHMGPKDKGYGYHRALAPSPNQRQLQYGYNPYSYGYSPYYQQPSCFWDCSGCGKL